MASTAASLPLLRQPPGATIDLDLLQRFDRGLGARQAERESIPYRVLGYGEISTAFEIDLPPFAGLAMKRVAVFQEAAEVARYLAAYEEYLRLLGEEIGLELPRGGHAAFLDAEGAPVVYIIQEKLAPPLMAHQALHYLPPAEAVALFRRALAYAGRVWDFNARQARIQVGFDAQLSNWAILDAEPGLVRVTGETRLAYVDTSTPLWRKDGREQLQAELFLRPAPSFLRWVLRRWFLDDVVGRYYDPPRVVIDMIANLYKEQKANLIPALIAIANEDLGSRLGEEVTAVAVRDYYREDRFIWQLYFFARRLDSRLHRLRGRPYRFILPGKIRR